MMLETLFAHQQQQQAFLVLLACGVALGLMLHIGHLLRQHSVLCALWDALTAASGALMLFLVILRFHGGLRAYGILGMLLGMLLYLAGLSQLVQGGVNLFQKYKNSRRPKEGNEPPGDESKVQKGEKR